jgi:hypothetical protein
MTTPKITRKAKGLLDKPLVLDAMMNGRYVVETKAGRFVGAFDTMGEAQEAAFNDERAAHHELHYPLDEQALRKLRIRMLEIPSDERVVRAIAALDDAMKKRGVTA